MKDICRVFIFSLALILFSAGCEKASPETGGKEPSEKPDTTEVTPPVASGTINDPGIAYMWDESVIPEITISITVEEWNKLLKRYDVRRCYYGHLHGASHGLAMEGIWDGVDFRLVSADYLNFSPVVVIP